MCSERQSDHQWDQESGGLALSCCLATSWRVDQARGRLLDLSDLIHFISKLEVIIICVSLTSGLF